MTTTSSLNTSVSPFISHSARILTEPPYLPIQLASFTGAQLAGGYILLEWVTLTEVHNYGFEIQRGDSQTLNFVTLPNGFVLGYGTTNIPQRYSFVDSSATVGTWWYRLRQIDLDGSFWYTEPIEVSVLVHTSVNTAQPRFVLEQHYPNPFNPTSTITYELPVSRFVRLRVYDVLGRQLASLVEGYNNAGRHSVTFDAHGLPGGTYLYRIQAGEFILTKKLLLLK